MRYSHVNTITKVNLHICMCMCVCIGVCEYVICLWRLYACLYVYICVYICLYVYIYVCICVYRILLMEFTILNVFYIILYFSEW